MKAVIDVRSAVLMYFIVLFAGLMAMVIIWTPFHSSQLGTEVAEYYLQYGPGLTGSKNVVNAIVWDFRGYDTLGEETVLFTAALGVFILFKRKIPHREVSEREEINSEGE